jgi:peroxiredoxin
VVDPYTLPADLPRPLDDGAAEHLPGMHLPQIALESTSGEAVRLDRLPGRAVIYAYPWTGRPGEPLLTDDWDLIPGARGCTPETCGFRDHHAELARAGAVVLGLSTQDPAHQRELAARLGLPFPILSDAGLGATRALSLPTFEAAGRTLIRRLTVIAEESVITHVFYPVFPPDLHASEVLAWLEANPARD